MILNLFLKKLEDLIVIILTICILITKSVYAFKGLVGFCQRKIKSKMPYHFELR